MSCINKRPLDGPEELIMASMEGLEPPTVRLEGACSIRLSYMDGYRKIIAKPPGEYKESHEEKLL